MANALNIGVIGAGNIGTAMAALLCQSGAEVFLAARGARLAHLRDHGVALDDRGSKITAMPQLSERLERPMDALFFCVKSQALASAIAENHAAVGPETLVIPMVNGMPFWFEAKGGEMGQIPYLDPKGDLARLLSPRQILGAVLLMTVRMDDEGQALSSNTPTLSLGGVSDGTDMERLATLVATLEEGGVRTDLCSDIRQKVLVKLLANITTNPLTALTGASLREVGETAALREIATQIAGEFRDWAGSAYELPSDAWLVDLFIDAGDFPTSMLQDARAGRTLELDAIARAPLELARRKGGDMPVLARLIEEMDRSATLPLAPEQIETVLSRLQTMTVISRG